ncbi:MAG: trypsin-like peptidase domain-containing protein [Candidatus Kerfeldbacteria bacterium]|nr:trypsin-like peptidase domain-containing protein [Candidatus Kerfeldbacteria bacterium]
MSSPPPSLSTPRPPSVLVPVVLVSLIMGGVSGGLVGYSLAAKRSPGTNTSSLISSGSTLRVEEDSATVEVVNKALPAVVSVIGRSTLASNSRPASPFDDFFFNFPFSQPQDREEVTQASGFIVDQSGLIVTNKHVVDNDQAQYSVTLNDNRTVSAKVLAKDPANDVAVLKIEADNLQALPLGDSDAVKIGQTVIAIGDPLRFRSSVTKGIISGKSRTITASDGSGQAETLEDVFQTDAAINPGNSGGPLLNLAGQVIAVNTAVSQEGQLIGFAVPISVVKRDLESVREFGTIVRPFLGVRYVLITETLAAQNELPVKEGAYIQPGEQGEPAVIAGSPADKAGLKENDIILEVNGEKITTEHSLAGLLAKYNPGQSITLKVHHDGQTKELPVTLERRSE